MSKEIFTKLPPHTCFKSLWLLILAISLCFSISGCGLLSASSGSDYSVSFTKGELSSKVNKDLETTWKILQKLAEESQFQIKSSRADAFSAVLKCEDAQQRKIDITLENETPKITRVKIRIGLLGDAELSGKIFDQLKAKLH